MFETLQNVVKLKDIRRKLLYVVWMILVIRIGSNMLRHCGAVHR